MKEILLLGQNQSGRKKNLADSLLNVAKPVVLTDCDLDHRYYSPLRGVVNIDSGEFVGTVKAEIDSEACLGCGMCQEQCRFDAVQGYISSSGQQKFTILDKNCTGCGVCQYICPESGIHDVDSEKGRWYASESPYGFVVHGKLDDSADNSGKLVGHLRKKAKELALRNSIRHVVTYGSDRSGCAELSAISATDYVIIVADTGASSIDNATRIGKLAGYFSIPTGAILFPNGTGGEDVDLNRLAGFDRFFLRECVQDAYDSANLDSVARNVWDAIEKLNSK